MKKILALVLVIGCIFAFASCEALLFGNTNTNTDNEGKEQTLANIQKCIDDAAPKSADISVEFKSEIGDLNGSYDVTYNEDGSATVDYSYELFNKFDENAELEEFKSTHTGVVTVSSNGDVDGDLNGIASIEAVSFDIKLDEQYLSSHKITASILEAKVEAENTFDVVGVDIPYDIDLSITTGNGRVTAVVISYETENGPIEIVAVYHY